MPTLPSGLSDIVADEEDLARFLTQNSQLSAFMPKHAAFLPNPRDRETSVSRHGSDPRNVLWSLGLAATGNRTLVGAAIIKAKVAREASLTVISDEPPPRHAVLKGWYWDDADPNLQKAKQKEVAIELASKAVLLRR